MEFTLLVVLVISTIIFRMYFQTYERYLESAKILQVTVSNYVCKTVCKQWAICQYCTGKLAEYVNKISMHVLNVNTRMGRGMVNGSKLKKMVSCGVEGH